MRSRQLVYLVTCTLVIFCALAPIHTVQAGCPFDDGSCQEYCSQQGCNLGYCGHFAWIQCICRKCGDEWNWYDKVHYNPDKQVNQTELDSLKLNASAPLILTNTNARRVKSQQEVQAGTSGGIAQQVPAGNGQSREASGPSQQQQSLSPPSSSSSTVSPPKEQKVSATLTTLLIPDLSDGSKLDLNDIPDENSEKFLDYLTKNHEKLVQATNTAQQSRLGSSSSSARSGSQEGDNDGKLGTDDDTETDDSDAEQQVTTPSSTSSEGELQADEAIEIQISSSNNNNNNNQASTKQTVTMTSANNKSGSGRSGPSAPSSGADLADEQQQQHQANGPVMRLLKMAVAERSPDDIL